MEPELSDFEQKLRQQPMKKLPDSFRSVVMKNVQSELASSENNTENWREIIYAWLWPHPKAWAILGAAWCLIFALHFNSPMPRGLYVKNLPKARVEQLVLAFVEQRKLLQLFLQPSPEMLAEPPRKQHSERRSQLTFSCNIA